MIYAFDFKYAGLVIEAAVGDDKTEWISTPTIENILDYEPDSTRKLLGSEAFKRFMGEGFQLGNFSRKDKSTKHNNLNRYYAKSLFLSVIYYIADYESYCLGQGKKLTPDVLARHRKIKNLVFAGFVADFEGAFQAALGNELDEEQREYLRQLVHDRIQAFRAWTDIIRDRHIKFFGRKPEGWYYGKLIKKANVALFGVSDFGNDRTENMTKEQQQTIKDFESFLSRKARNNAELEPECLLELALEQFTS
jgi:hypothetical protein